MKGWMTQKIQSWPKTKNKWLNYFQDFGLFKIVIQKYIHYCSMSLKYDKVTSYPQGVSILGDKSTFVRNHRPL